jgi:hypothetical protein
MNDIRKNYLSRANHYLYEDDSDSLDFEVNTDDNKELEVSGDVDSVSPDQIDFVADFWNAGKANEKGFTEKDANPEQLAKGIDVEMKEHTTNNELAKKIALDHLAEFEFYYDALEKMENELKAEQGETSEENDETEENNEPEKTEDNE